MSLAGAVTAAPVQLRGEEPSEGTLPGGQPPPQPSSGEEGSADESRLDLKLSLRGDAWSGSRRLDAARAIGRTSAWGRARLDLGAAGGLVGDGWLAAQTRDTAPGQHGRLRELYWQGSAGRVDWKVGRQNVVWGRADGLNPTDNLSPRDFTLLVPQDNDQRRGNEAVQLRLDTGSGSLTGLWFPRAASHTLPLPALPQTAYAVAGAPHKPQVALKLDVSAAGADGSVSYFRGSDPVPDLSPGNVGPGGLQVVVRNNPLRVLGADLSATQGETVWRAEAAWLRSDASRSNSSSGADDFVRKKHRLWLIAGGERTLAGNTTLGLQASLQHVANFRSPDGIGSPLAREVAWRSAAIANQTSANQLGVIWRLAGRWDGDALTAETSGVVMGGPRSGIWRTQFGYALNDRLQLQAGTDVYFGPKHSLWGQFRRNRLAYVQLRYGM